MVQLAHDNRLAEARLQDFNSRSVGWEMGGYEKNGFSEDPPRHRPLWRLRTLLIICKYPDQARSAGGVGPGIESHWGLGAAGGGHGDPSHDPAFMDGFIARVQAHYNKGEFPAVWEPQKGFSPCSLVSLAESLTKWSTQITVNTGDISGRPDVSLSWLPKPLRLTPTSPLSLPTSASLA